MQTTNALTCRHVLHIHVYPWSQAFLLELEWPGIIYHVTDVTDASLQN